jgi:hypothetical protein
LGTGTYSFSCHADDLLSGSLPNRFNGCERPQMRQDCPLTETTVISAKPQVAARSRTTITQTWSKIAPDP